MNISIEDKKLKILGLTLARGGSKSIPRKNIKSIAGLPLIGHTISEALKSKLLTRYLISTDDEEIQQISINLGAESPFIRPDVFSTDTASSVAALQHAVKWVEEQEGVVYDYIVELMCTNPLKTKEDIDLAITKIIETGADSVIAVHLLEDHHPARIKKIINDRIADFCIEEIPESRRQDLKPDAFIRSGSIYVLKRDHLMKDNRRYGSVNSRPYILPAERAVNVDTEIDFLVAEFILKNRGEI
jgi:CMP-N,N'-diacetyllegionaminic acid synthase